jgi:membrane-associated phospholipid phosphatase
MSRLIAGIGILAITLQTSAAQTPLGPERRDLGDLRGDIWSVWSSPARIDHRAIVPLAAVAGAVTLTALSDSSIYAWMLAHPNSGVMLALRPLRENWRLPLYELGSGQYLLPASAAAYIGGRLAHNAEWRDGGLGCAAAHLSSAALREVIYLVVSRKRPQTSPNPDKVSVPGKRAWANHSFLSGHFANSMACASYLGHRYSLGLAEPAMYTYVSLIGMGRVADGWHWMSDAVAGGAMGLAIGKAIADRQFARASARSGVAGVTVNVPLGSFRF